VQLASKGVCVKYLFVHQNYPGQYLHIVKHLLKNPSNEIVFLGEPNTNFMSGVRRVFYEMPRKPRTDIHPNATDYEYAAFRADQVARAASNVKALGFTPDIMIGHHGWGEMLNLIDVWPGVPMLGYFEYYYNMTGYDVDYDAEFKVEGRYNPGIRAMNIVNHQALSQGQHGQTPTHFQRSTYPDWAQRQIDIIPECADLLLCKPDPAARKRDFAIGGFTVHPADKLITYVARNLEPYRGVHVMMRALPAIMAARPDAKVIMVGGDEVSYGAKITNTTWREFYHRQIKDLIDPARLLTPGQVPYDVYRAMLQRSDAHVYLTYPFVASWSLREALACGCAVVGADVAPVAEFITHGKNGLLTPGLDSAKLADSVLEVLENTKLSQKLRRGARAYAKKNLDMGIHISAFEEKIKKLTENK
jgi:glycosyltransferase involved in cell wall biosynthesis